MAEVGVQYCATLMIIMSIQISKRQGIAQLVYYFLHYEFVRIGFHLVIEQFSYNIP